MVPEEFVGGVYVRGVRIFKPCLTRAQHAAPLGGGAAAGGWSRYGTLIRLHEYSGYQCVSRERFGGRSVRRTAGGGGGGGAIQSSQVRGGISGGRDSLLPEGSGSEAGRNRPCGGAAESAGAVGHKAVLCAAHALVRAWPGQGAGEIYQRARSTSGSVRKRSRENQSTISSH